MVVGPSVSVYVNAMVNGRRRTRDHGLRIQYGGPTLEPGSHFRSGVARRKADKVNLARKISAGDVAEMVRTIVGAYWMVLCAGGCLVSDGKIIFSWSHFQARLAAALRVHPP